MAQGHTLARFPRYTCLTPVHNPPPPPASSSPPPLRSGFARFTNTRYSTKKEDITNTYMHLTNVAIQKHAPGFDASKGMKW